MNNKNEIKEVYKLKNLIDFYKLIPLLKKDGHEVNADYIINFKSKFLLNMKYGLSCFYKSGYFFYEKKYQSF